MRRAIVLLSGGLDSTTILAVAKVEGFALYALSFDYGQRHVREIEAARKAADVFGVKEHKIIKIDLGVFGHSALTANISVPKKKIAANISSQIPITYVPARNTIFLSYALAWADVTGARDIFIGINAIDYSGYPDCRPEYVKAYEKMAGLATKSAVEGRPVKIRTPLINMTKSEIIKKGISLGVDYGSTHSCYDPDEQGTACGECASCLLRKKGFKEAGIEDPIKYK